MPTPRTADGKCPFCEIERLEAELAPLRAYREAYFAHHAKQMREHRELEHKQVELDDEAFEAWCDEQQSKSDFFKHPNNYSRMRDAECALTAEEHWPEDYKKLVAEMKEEFGDE